MKPVSYWLRAGWIIAGLSLSLPFVVAGPASAQATCEPSKPPAVPDALAESLTPKQICPRCQELQKEKAEAEAKRLVADAERICGQCSDWRKLSPQVASQPVTCLEKLRARRVAEEEARKSAEDEKKSAEKAGNSAEAARKEKEADEKKKEADKIARLIALAERQARAAAKKLLADAADMNAKVLSPEVDLDAKDALIENIRKVNDRAQKLRAVVNVNTSKWQENFEDTEEWFFRFDAGVEYVTIKDALERGFARAGLTAYTRFGGTRLTEDDAGWDLRRYGFHQKVRVELGNSGELCFSSTSNAFEKCDDKPLDTTTTTVQPEEAINVDVDLFWPMFRSVPKNSSYYRAYFGPVGSFGGRKTDSLEQIEYRYYGGFRISSGPGSFADILYGRTQSLRSDRLEIRTQVPMPGFSPGLSRIYLGAIGNFGVGEERKSRRLPDRRIQLAEPDVIRIFLAWNVDFKTLFNGGS